MSTIDPNTGKLILTEEEKAEQLRQLNKNPIGDMLSSAGSWVGGKLQSLADSDPAVANAPARPVMTGQTLIEPSVQPASPFDSNDLGQAIKTTISQPSIQLEPKQNITQANTDITQTQPAYTTSTKGFDLEGKAIGEQEAAMKAKGLKEIEIETERSLKNLESLKSKQDEQRSIDSEYFKSMEDLGKKQSEYASKEYGGFWQDKSIGQKVLAGIAIALGSRIDGNRALDSINKMKDDDYKKFQDKKAKELQVIKDSKLDAATKQAYATKSIQDAFAYRLAQDEQSLSKMKEVAAKLGIDAQSAQYKQLQAQLLQKKERNLMEMDQFNANLAKTKAELKAMQAPAGADLETVVPIKDKDGNMVEFRARSKTEAKELRQVNSEIDESQWLISQIKELTKNGINISEREKMAELESLKQSLVGKLRLPLQGPGAMTETDRENLLKAIGDPSAVFGLESSALKSLNTIEKALEQKRDYMKQNQLIAPDGTISSSTSSDKPKTENTNTNNSPTLEEIEAERSKRRKK